MLHSRCHGQVCLKDGDADMAMTVEAMRIAVLLVTIKFDHMQPSRAEMDFLCQVQAGRVLFRWRHCSDKLTAK